MSGPRAWASKYITDVETHGPLPPPIKVVRNGDNCQYQLRVDNQSRVFLHHPLSPHGRKEWGDVLARLREGQGSKADFPGVAHPPIIYKPSEWVWKRMDTKSVMIRALQISNVNVTEKDLQDQKNVDAVNRLMGTRQQLYHPRDRVRLGLFEGEHKISCWARFFGRGLVIVGPEFDLNRKNWAAHKQSDYKNRPTVRARYSTGDQEEFLPIVVGCLPTGEQAATWFFLEPVEATRNVFDNLWKGCKWVDQATKFGYTDSEKFIWAAVSIQRSIVLQAAQNNDNLLGDVLRQYGKYLTADDGHGKKPFVYSPGNGPPSSPTLTFHELTRWILISDQGSSAKRYAKAWDKTVLLRVAHRKSLTLPDWKSFLDAVAAMQIKK